MQTNQSVDRRRGPRVRGTLLIVAAVMAWPAAATGMPTPLVAAIAGEQPSAPTSGVVGPDGDASDPTPTSPATAGVPDEEQEPATDGPVDLPIAPAVDDSGGILTTSSWSAAAAIAGAFLGFVLGRGRKRPSPVPTTSPGPAPPVVDTARGAEATIDSLVEGLIASHDLASSDGQRSRVVATLRRAGVARVAPETGDVFEPEHHQALGSEPAPSVEQRGRIARTERPGWTRGDMVIRFPEVVVWR